jgi:hypothetical protein
MMNAQRQAALVDVFVQRQFSAADGSRPDSTRLDPCLDLHGIHRERSYLARDGRRTLCHFRAPDAESLRIALRVAGVDYDALWTGAVSNIPGATRLELVIEKAVERALGENELRALRASTARQLLELGAEPAQVLLSRCRKRVLWLCRVITPEAVKAAESQLADRGYEVWACDTEYLEKMT